MEEGSEGESMDERKRACPIENGQALKKRQSRRLRSEIQSACALDLTGDLAMHLSRHSRDATWENFSGGRGEFRQQIGIGVIDFVNRDILATTGHTTIRLTESNAALDGFWFGFLHDT
jgi:hypothetical protein